MARRRRSPWSLMLFAAVVLLLLVVLLLATDVGREASVQAMKSFRSRESTRMADAPATATAVSKKGPSVTRTAAAGEQAKGDVGLPGQHDTASDALVAWLRENGGEVNIAIRDIPGQGRGTFAASDLLPGDVMASIPVELVYAANYSWGPGFESAGAQLVFDMADPNSFWQPYFSSLPKLGKVINKEFIPEAYFPILQDDNTVRAIRMIQETTHHYCQLLQPAYAQLGAAVNTSLCLHAVALLTTRTFYYGNKEVLVPIVDLANHDNTCAHTHRLEPCDRTLGDKQRAETLLPPPVPPSFASGVVVPVEGAGPGDAAVEVKKRGVSGVCLVWRAESPVAAGMEVCNNYGLLLQDNSLLQYGYLQAGPIAQELSMMDRPEHSQEFEKVWDKPHFTWGQELPDKFTGTVEELLQEVGRLSQRLAWLREADSSIAAIQADRTADPDGRLLGLMLEWRRQRLSALEAEIERVSHQADELREEL